jgi:hypothetical protein
MTPEIEQENRETRLRELNRLRVARHRARTQTNVTRARARSNGNGNDVMLDDGLPNSTLTRVAVNLARGMSQRQALREAGSSEKASILIDKAKAGLAELLAKEHVTVKAIAQSVAKRLEATSPMLTAEGCIERPDWAAHATGCKDAIALLDRAGELPQPSQSTGTGNVTLVLQSLNVTLDVVDAHADNDVITSEAYKVLNP